MTYEKMREVYFSDAIKTPEDFIRRYANTIRGILMEKGIVKVCFYTEKYKLPLTQEDTYRGVFRVLYCGEMEQLIIRICQELQNLWEIPSGKIYHDSNFFYICF